MTLTTEAAVPQASDGLQPVRVVDSDVHTVPKRGEFAPFLPDWLRQTYLNRMKGIGNSVYYDAPDFYFAQAMRTETFPPDGNFAGSDPDLLFQHVVLDAGCDLVILGPLMADIAQTEEESLAFAAATNAWQDAHWLDSEHNWHQRFYGSIFAAVEAPEEAGREIERWAGHPYMAQVLINAEPRPAWGAPMYDPIWRAAVKHDLPVACHLGRGQYNLLPMSPVGFMSYNHDLMVAYSMLAANQIMSLVFDGTFDRFPELKIVLIEHGFNWILPLMARMDAMHEARGSELGLRRKPSEYVKDNIWFTTQPLDYPEDKVELTNALEWMEADRLLMFSSDYPHWTFDEPSWVAKHIPLRMRDAVMHGNAIDVFHLPSSVPAIADKKVAY